MGKKLKIKNKKICNFQQLIQIDLSAVNFWLSVMQIQDAMRDFPKNKYRSFNLNRVYSQ
ncbi:Uncharacterized protein dnm_029920 [Desulfonema magnum]|uniref:Uncharacterized protein n=1 Tax=Desulfonema magnum TaxID=45655 RepID=A0A975BKV7_9BACT|nr:Uncharacterized protein dnm_029920 [Desulfonema magnum]